MTSHIDPKDIALYKLRIHGASSSDIEVPFELKPKDFCLE